MTNIFLLMDKSNNVELYFFVFPNSWPRLYIISIWKQFYTEKIMNSIIKFLKKSRSPLDFKTQIKSQSHLDIETVEKSLGLISKLKIRKRILVSSRHCDSDKLSLGLDP